MATPLLIGPKEIDALKALATAAFANVLDVREIKTKCQSARGKREHMDQMNKQTVFIPFDFLVTFSVESGHPVGTCRHMSMSSNKEGRAPTPEAVWMIAEQLGFTGSLESCAGVWQEELQRGEGKRAVAINVVQPVHLQ